MSKVEKGIIMYELGLKDGEEQQHGKQKNYEI